MLTPETHLQTYPVEVATLRGEAVTVDLQTGLPESDPANIALAEAGVQGRAALAIEAGAQRFVVTDISGAPEAVGSGLYVKNYEPFSLPDKAGRQSPTQYRLPVSSPYVLFHFAADGSVTGRAVKPGEPIVLGRDARRVDNKSGRFEYANDLRLAPHHVTIQPDNTGQQLQVTSLDSNFDTQVRYGVDPNSQKQEKRRTLAPQLGILVASAGTVKIPNVRVERSRKEPDYAHALKVEPYELWMQEDNGSRTFNLAYIEYYKQVRKRLVNAFESGALYTNTDSFKQVLQDVHTYLGRTDIYNKVNNGGGLEEQDLGKFRDDEFRPSNRRVERSRNVVSIAARYGDPYGAQNRLQHGKPNSEHYSYVYLNGVSQQNLPVDVVRYDERGNRRENGGYQYYYPSGKALDEYMTQMTALGQHIEMEVKGGNPNIYEALQLIGRQYQYGACDRSFVHVNNSIFMELANAQVKMLGRKGMTHGEMDIAAQRLQPDAFARYFAARALGQEPDHVAGSA